MSYQISLFESPRRSCNSSIAPLFDVPRKSRAETEAAVDESVFSEISLSGRSQQCLHLLAPILRELSEGQDNRWLTLVSPPKQITAQWLRDAGLNRERILLLRPRGIQSSQDLAYEALRLGCSHTVISWFNPLPKAARNRLIKAALAGVCQSLNVRQFFKS